MQSVEELEVDQGPKNLAEFKQDLLTEVRGEADEEQGASLLESLWRSVSAWWARSRGSRRCSDPNTPKARSDRRSWKTCGQPLHTQVLDAQRPFERAVKKRAAREYEVLELDEEIARIEARWAKANNELA